MTEPLVDVLLATHNGARYLEPQLESLLRQSHRNLRVLVSDDGSSDETMAIVQRFRPRFDGRLQCLAHARPAGGVVRNFERLMRFSADDAAARWAAFCDHDDVWHDDKIATLALHMGSMERRLGRDLPCAVHSDLRVVDAQLAVLHPSFMTQQCFKPASVRALQLLSINQVTGCAMMVNQALLRAALPLPEEAIMHDWWCALIAMLTGQCDYVDRALVDYRQHDTNQLGARDRSVSKRLQRLQRDRLALLHRVRALGRATYAQAQALQQRLQARGLDDTIPARYLRWRDQGLLRRLTSYRTYYAGPELDRLSRCLLW